MKNLPELGERVRVWPAPGRRVQLDARPVAHDRGGRYLDEGVAEGQEVVWSPFHLEQLRAGDIYLHNPQPPCLALAEVEAAPAAAEPPALAAEPASPRRRGKE